MSDSGLSAGISGSNGNGTPTKAGSSSSIPRPKSARSKKGVARDRSISRSPAPSQNNGQPQLFIPTALHIPQQSPSALGSPTGFVNSPRPMGNQNTIQRKSSMASIAADDARATPTPSESSVGGPAGGQPHHVTYTAEEVANAHKKSDEFLKQLPGFTSENFVEFLQKFLKDNDISGNFSKPPIFGDKPIDLYRFFCEVVKQGGLEQVHVRRVWRQVAKDSGLPDIPTLPPLLSRWYKVWLQPLEQLAVYPPGHPKHTGISANFSLKKRRKPDTFGSPGSTPGPIERPYSVNPDSSKRPKMYSPITNGAASATASPAPFTPPPPLSISS
ncbi:At rich interactive domain, partial [Coemansia sp. RSA 2559]